MVGGIPLTPESPDGYRDNTGIDHTQSCPLRTNDTSLNCGSVSAPEGIRTPNLLILPGWIGCHWPVGTPQWRPVNGKVSGHAWLPSVTDIPGCRGPPAFDLVAEL